VTMKDFLGEDFLLQNEPAKILFHEYAETMPIFDYHNHLVPRQIAEDMKFENLARIWFDGDHYKWRLMRAFGIDEKYITGDSTDYEKYQAWSRTVPFTVGNCLYQWTHMELKNPFGITGKLFGPDTAEEIWKTTGELLKRDDFSVCSIIRRMNVKVMCTTDDPIDPLDQHALIRKRHGGFVVVPTFRPDAALAVENPQAWNVYRGKLEAAAGMSIRSFEDFVRALDKRHEFFHGLGARATDHAIVCPFAEEYSKDEIEKIFGRLTRNEALSQQETLQFKTAGLYEVGRMNHRRGWVMQLHMSALRNNNSRQFKRLGPDSGFNSMADFMIAAPLSRFLDLLDRTDELPKTVLFSLNQNHNDTLATMAGNFMDGRIRGKVQFGAAWWFNDQKDGIERHLVSIANMGMMAVFIGMLTDAASVFAFIRHEYFRRIICNVIGKWIDDGELPRDFPHIGGIVRDICYTNAARFFSLAGD
jgi:glucuronate isomerase